MIGTKLKIGNTGRSDNINYETKLYNDQIWLENLEIHDKQEIAAHCTSY